MIDTLLWIALALFLITPLTNTVVEIFKSPTLLTSLICIAMIVTLLAKVL